MMHIPSSHPPCIAGIAYDDRRHAFAPCDRTVPAACGIPPRVAPSPSEPPLPVAAVLFAARRDAPAAARRAACAAAAAWLPPAPPPSSSPSPPPLPVAYPRLRAAIGATRIGCAEAEVLVLSQGETCAAVLAAWEAEPRKATVDDIPGACGRV